VHQVLLVLKDSLVEMEPAAQWVRLGRLVLLELVVHKALLEQLDLRDLQVWLDQTALQVSQVASDQLVRREHQALVGPVE